MISRAASLSAATIADGLTASRFVLAVAVVPLVASGAWRAAAIVVAVAWWTDFFDGRLARRTTGTRLGDWDPRADTAVGAGIVIGLAAGGHVPALPWLLAGGLFAAIYLFTGNFAFGQLVQALGYGPLLWFAAGSDAIALGVLAGTIAAVGVMDAPRFVSHTLPAFFEGMRLRRRSP